MGCLRFLFPPEQGCSSYMLHNLNHINCLNMTSHRSTARDHTCADHYSFFCSCECSSQTDSARRQQAGTDTPAGHFKKESGAVLMCGMRAASTEGHGFAKPIASPALKVPQCGACPSIETRATCKTFRAKRDVPQRHAVSLGHVYAEPRPPPPRRSGARLKKVPVPFLRF